MSLYLTIVTFFLITVHLNRNSDFITQLRVKSELWDINSQKVTITFFYLVYLVVETGFQRFIFEYILKCNLLLLKTHFLLLSKLKTVVLLNIYVETMIKKKIRILRCIESLKEQHLFEIA